MIYTFYLDSMEVDMQLAKWGNSLAVRIPKVMIDELGLKEGDDVTLRSGGGNTIELSRDDARMRAIARIRELAVDMPPGWTFSREDANER